MRRGKSRWKLLWLALLGAAVYTELQKDPADREWNGKVGGVVPYDLRTPSFDRFKAAVWNPEDDRIFTPSPFGVGWTLNLAQVKELARAATEQ
jgi:hypothetical protein